MGPGDYATLGFPDSLHNREDDVSDRHSDDDQDPFRQSYLGGSRTQSDNGSGTILSVAVGPLRRG